MVSGVQSCNNGDHSSCLLARAWPCCDDDSKFCRLTGPYLPTQTVKLPKLTCCVGRPSTGVVGRPTTGLIGLSARAQATVLNILQNAVPMGVQDSGSVCTTSRHAGDTGDGHSEQLTLSNRKAKSTCTQSPVVASSRMFSPCRSPRPTICPTMDHTAVELVNVSRA